MKKSFYALLLAGVIGLEISPILAQAPLNPALIGPQFGQPPALAPNTPLGGHLSTGVNNPVPTAPGTTTCTLVAGSTDTAGQCVATATSGVAVTFATAFNVTPFCVVLDHTTFSGNALASISKTGFTMGTTVSADVITWVCLAAPGG